MAKVTSAAFTADGLSDSWPSDPAEARVPFSAEYEICHDLTLRSINDDGDECVLCPTRDIAHPCLPNQPFVSLDQHEVLSFLQQDLLTPLLNRMAPHLWLVTTPRSSHVSPLNDQIVRGRAIVVTEKPELHMVWVEGRIFIKPLPAYLVSHAFWSYYFGTMQDGRFRFPQVEVRSLAKAARGFVRTYCWLIRHESDFRMAQKEGLIPAKTRWPAFARFIREFGEIQDAQVSERDHFGEIRLTRLNLWAPIFLRRWVFHKITWHYGEYFARLYGPVIFLFAIGSLVLGAMQVGVAARPNWSTFSSVSAWFVVATLAFTAAVIVFFVMTLLYMVGRELLYASKKQIKKTWRLKRRARAAATQSKDPS